MSLFEYSSDALTAAEIYDAYKPYGQAAEECLNVFGRLFVRTLEAEGNEPLVQAMIGELSLAYLTYKAAYDQAQEATTLAAKRLAINREAVLEEAYGELTATELNAHLATQAAVPEA